MALLLKYLNAPGGQIDDLWLAAGTDFHYLPTASVPRTLHSLGFSHLASPDLNGDGYTDVILSTTDYQLGTALEIFRGNAVGDLNGDGRADLAFSVDDNSDNRGIHTYLQQANGTLKPGPTLATSLLTTAIFIADLNGDGLQDIALAGGNGPGISLVYQGRSGTFAAAVPDNRFNGQPIGLVDVNRD
jgi:hypothetical protein